MRPGANPFNGVSMNKKAGLIALYSAILCIIALGLVAATVPPARLMRLTVINKSGRKVEIRLTGMDQGGFYYLHVPEGDRQTPFEQIFTVFPDHYSSTLYYVEIWDPVYGFHCASRSQRLDLTRNVRVVVVECDRRVPNVGEPPSTIKYGGHAQKRGR